MKKVLARYAWLKSARLYMGLCKRVEYFHVNYRNIVARAEILNKLIIRTNFRRKKCMTVRHHMDENAP